MANARAIANGNWSSTSTWNGGVVPGNGDTVYANGFNVTLDTDVNIGGANNPIVNTGSLVSGQWYEIVNVGGQTWTTLGAASNTVGTVFQSSGTGTAGNLGTARALATLTTATNAAAGATTGGGVFTMSTVRAMTADLRAGLTNCLDIVLSSGVAEFNGLRIVGGSTGTGAGLRAVNSNFNLSNSIVTAGAIGNAISFSGSGYIANITGSGIFTTSGQTSALNVSNGTLNVTGSCTFTGGNGDASCVNINSGTLNVTGSCTFTGGSGANSRAIINSGSGTLNVTGSCTFTGGSGAVAAQNISTGTFIIGNSTFTASAFTNAVTISNTGADVRLSGNFLDHWSGWKAVSGSKWRLGTAPTLGQTRYALAGTTDSYFTMYGADNGSFGNPIAANVRSGVSYGGGNITGSLAVPLPSQVAVGVATDNTVGTAFVTGSDIATAVWGASTRSITGGTVDALTNAPASVTPSDIWSHASRTITGGTVTTLTNAPSVPSAASIRAEIDSNSTQLAAIKSKTDNLPASPAATGDIPSANITAIKAKTDLLVTDRLAQCSTVATTGAQLAAALS